MNAPKKGVNFGYLVTFVGRVPSSIDPNGTGDERGEALVDGTGDCIESNGLGGAGSTKVNQWNKDGMSLYLQRELLKIVKRKALK